jgi:hypothetical protein
MLSFVLYTRTSWNDFFTGSFTKYDSQTYTSRHTPSGTSVYVSNCLFKYITSTSNGGALFCSNTATNFLVESSSFFTCKTSIHGGAIYFQNSNNGQCILYKVCGNDCYTTTNGNSYQFAYLYVNDAVSSRNYVNYSSISRCVNENTYHLLAFQYGTNYCPSINISLNKCSCYSGITSWCTLDSNSVACSLTYSSFSDNNSNNNRCILLNRGGAKFEIESCNILRNTQGTLSSYGTIWTSGYLNIYDSCILENNANNIFYQHSSSYTITLSNCTVDKTTCNQNLVTQNTVTKSFILALNHMSTRNCHSEYDSAGILTPIIQTSKKQKLCYTHIKCFNQCGQSDFFSLLFVFIFNFIHPYVSNYPL